MARAGTLPGMVVTNATVADAELREFTQVIVKEADRLQSLGLTASDVTLALAGLALTALASAPS